MKADAVDDLIHSVNEVRHEVLSLSAQVMDVTKSTLHVKTMRSIVEGQVEFMKAMHTQFGAQTCSGFPVAYDEDENYVYVIYKLPCGRTVTVPHNLEECKLYTRHAALAANAEPCCLQVQTATKSGAVVVTHHDILQMPHAARNFFLNRPERCFFSRESLEGCVADKETMEQINELLRLAAAGTHESSAPFKVTNVIRLA